MIVQFSHNGDQLNISSRSSKNGEAYKFDEGSIDKGIRFWNKEEGHKRKFIKNHGWYLENIDNSYFNPVPQEDDLYFWGEWEPQSKFQLTGNDIQSKTLPHAIHSPFLSKQGIGRHNTDPFVFGDNFYYTNCKQQQSRQGKMMLRLTHDSIILFGSEINKMHFVMDTLFVVGKDETVGNHRKNMTKYPDQLNRATIDLNEGLSDWMRLYTGKMYDFNNHYEENGSQYIFCLFPCKVGEDGEKGFPRPIIDVKKFNLKTVGSGTVLMKVDYSSEFNFWHDIVAELITQGYSLGIKASMPEIFD